MQARIGLIGDHDPAVTAHRAIPAALARAAKELEADVEPVWLRTATLGHAIAAQLAPFHGLWCVPASPYSNAAGALAAIRWARETPRPFLGTCGGFQHALLDYAQAAWNVRAPAHAETDPEASDPIIAPLACSLVERASSVRFEPGSRLARWYGVPEATETYHCRYGLARNWAARLSAGPLRVAARDAEGEVRAVELDGHPFFVATLYQPERSALVGQGHPVVEAFVRAALAHCSS